MLRASSHFLLQTSPPPPRCSASYVTQPLTSLTPRETLPNSFFQSKTLDPVTLFHSPSLASSTRALTILKQASTAASETATEDQASDYSSHAKQQRGDFELEVTTDLPTSDQLRSILDYISPTSGVGGQGEKSTYRVSEIIRGARDAEDALKLFKEDKESFIRPVVCLPCFVFYL